MQLKKPKQSPIDPELGDLLNKKKKAFAKGADYGSSETTEQDDKVEVELPNVETKADSPVEETKTVSKKNRSKSKNDEQEDEDEDEDFQLVYREDLSDFPERQTYWDNPNHPKRKIPGITLNMSLVDIDQLKYLAKKTKLSQQELALGAVRRLLKREIRKLKKLHNKN